MLPLYTTTVHDIRIRKKTSGYVEQARLDIRGFFLVDDSPLPPGSTSDDQVIDSSITDKRD